MAVLIVEHLVALVRAPSFRGVDAYGHRSSSDSRLQTLLILGHDCSVPEESRTDGVVLERALLVLLRVRIGSFGINTVGFNPTHCLNSLFPAKRGEREGQSADERLSKISGDAVKSAYIARIAAPRTTTFLRAVHEVLLGELHQLSGGEEMRRFDGARRAERPTTAATALLFDTSDCAFLTPVDRFRQVSGNRNRGSFRWG